MKVRHSVVIARPLPEVFAFMADIARTETLWQPDIRSVVFIDGSRGLRVGARFVEIRRSFGLTLEWTFVVTDFEPLARYAIRSLSGRPAYSGVRHFRAVSGGTEVTEEGEVAIARPLAPIAAILRPLAERPLQVAYQRLKEHLEA